MNDNQPPNRTNSANDVMPSQDSEGNLTTTHLRRRRLRRIRTLVFFISIAFILALATSWYVRKQRQEAERLDQAVTWHEKRTLEGHQTIVESIAISPDGKTLASASADKTIKLWELASGRNISTFTGHNDIVDGVAFSPDGKRLASAGADETVRLWEVASEKNLTTLKDHWTIKLLSYVTGANHVRSVAFSPDGKMLASAHRYNRAKLWDVVSHQPLATLEGHKRSVRRVKFSPDGKTLASASYDGTIRLWDVASHQLLALFKGHKDIVYEIAFSPDGKTLASASADRTIKLWEVP